MSALVSTAGLLSSLKAAGESTRLRILVLLLAGELNVKDLTRVLGQSQPRISRHLKLLVEAGLIERFREGSWVYFRLAEGDVAHHIRHLLTEAIDPADRVLARDRERARAVNHERSAAAQNYFEAHAAEWDRIRALHIADLNVERAMLEAVNTGLGQIADRSKAAAPVALLVDLGTGTGRMLELFADHARRAIGIDMNQAMLSHARAKLEALGLRHCQIRHGDLYNVPLPDAQADIVVLHQVLHFLDDPARAVREAARLLAPGGRLLIVDFAPHELEFLRDDHAHRRLGLATEQVTQWLETANLGVISQRDLKPNGPSAKNHTEKLTVSLWLCAARQGVEIAPAIAPPRKRGSKNSLEIVI
jgi:ubiquinone/menaquinone biosynthesis C-methylase UbiE/DNA-binding transcriptional ArsR family regulator